MQGSDWWEVVGSTILGAVGSTVGSAFGGTVGAYLGGAAGGLLGTFLFSGQDAQFWFFDSNVGYYDFIDLGNWQTVQNVVGWDSDGYTIGGSFDPNSNTVTVTVIAN